MRTLYQASRLALFATVILTVLSVRAIAGNGSGTIEGYLKSNSMAVEGEAPGKPPIPSTRQYCSYSRAYRATPPSGVTYYWQSGPSGTQRTNSGSYYQSGTSKWVYLRAYNGQWSSTSVPVYLAVKPAVPNPATSPDSRCGTGQVNLGASSSQGYTIEWYLSTNTSTIIAEGPTYKPNLGSSGSYVAKARRGDGCRSSGRTVKATVHKKPSTPTVSGNTPRCGTGTTALSASGSSGSTIAWHYNGSNTAESMGTGKTVILDNGQAKDYQVRAYLTSSTCYSSENITVKSYAKPEHIGVAGPTEICDNVRGMLKAISTSPGNTVFNWYAGGNKVRSNSSTLPLISKTTGAVNYVVKAYIESSTCYSTMEQTVNHKAAPDPPAVADNSTCGPGDVLLEATNTGAGITFEWLDGSTKATGNEYTAKNVGKTRPVTVKSFKNGCEASSATYAKAVYKERPEITSTKNGSTVETGPVKLSATTDESGGVVHWYLENNTGTVLAEGPSFSPVISATTTFLAKAILNGCSSGAKKAVGHYYPLEWGFSSPQSTVPPGATEGIPMKSEPLGIDYISKNTLSVGGNEYNNYKFYPNGGTFHLDLKCNSNWSITDMPDWLEPGENFQASGSQDISLDFGFGMHYNNPDRQDYIGFSLGKGSTGRVYLTQAAKTLTGEVTGGTLANSSVKGADVYLSSNTISLGGGTEAIEYNITNYESIIDVQITADDDINWNLEVINSNPNDVWAGQPLTSSGTGSQVVSVPISGNFGGRRTATIKVYHGTSPITTIYLEQQSVANYGSTTPMNFVMSTAYCDEGRVMGQSIQYYDKLGKPTQSLVRDLSNNTVIAGEASYDEYGRIDKSYLPVPIDKQDLNYINKFLVTSNYDDMNHVQRYYSASNTDEPYVPENSDPYSMVEYSKSVPGAVRKSYMAGASLRERNLGQAPYSTGFTLNASPDEIMKLDFLGYVNLKALKPGYRAGNSRGDYQGMTKTVSKDAMGKETVAYYNAEGQVIATAMTSKTGTARKYAITNTIKTDGENGYTDFHLPNDGQGDYTIRKSAGWSFELIDLETDGLAADGNSYVDKITGVKPGFYRMVCTGGSSGTKGFTIAYSLEYRHYAFNAYDGAGRLVRSISPKGVEELVAASPPGAGVESFLEPRVTRNTYGAFGRLVATESPDEGLARFVYRRDGSIRASQNAQQAEDSTFSYTNYDRHGRVVEVGVYNEEFGNYRFEDIDGNSAILEDRGLAGEGFYGDSANSHQQTFTSYSLPGANLPRQQTFVRGRVSKTWNANAATWYSYLYDGKLDWAVQEIDGLDLDNDGTANSVLTGGIEDPDDLVTLDYAYECSGNVGEVVYQAGKPDEFAHFYEYDYDGRLEAVYTKTSGTHVVSNKIADWQLDNNGKDISVNSNSGGLIGAKGAPDRFGAANSAVGFDGVDDCIKVGDVESFNHSFDNGITISAWFKLDADPMESGKNMNIISKGGVFGNKPISPFALTFFKGNNRLYFDLWDLNNGEYTRSMAISTPVDWEIGRWYHVLATWDGTKNHNSQKIYIDGVLNKQRNSLVDKLLVNSNELVIGESNGYYFKGGIDDVKVFARGASDDESIAMYNNENNPSQKTLQARYHYYRHGPLKRVELGGSLQGVDYTYTLNGWLKSINNPNGADPGGDGSGEHANFAEDIFAMALDYYNKDYTNSRIDLGNAPAAANYDGNIHRQRFYNKGTVATTPANQHAWRYAYDERNFLKSAAFGAFNAATGLFTANARRAYLVNNLAYDANGNILSLDRYTQYGDLYDYMRYHYKSGLNQLDYISDAGDDSEYTGFDEDETFLSQAAGNYAYNNIGQLVYDRQGNTGKEGHRFVYDAYGKVTSVKKGNNSAIADYAYNDAGFRIKKHLANGNKVWNIRDASGNIMATYHTISGTTTLKEQPIYASGRIGMGRTDATGSIAQYTYELTDHLGNVRATFTSDGDGNGAPDILSATNYYPFGHEMLGSHSFTSQGYRFGYQGQFAEKDGETGYSQFEARLYDSRIGRWLTTDPAKQYWSLYLGMGNSWPNGIDPDGREWYTNWFGKQKWFDVNPTGLKSLFWSMNPNDGFAFKTESGAWENKFYEVQIKGSIPMFVKTDAGYYGVNSVWADRFMKTGTITQGYPTTGEKIQNFINDQPFPTRLVGNVVYGISDDAYVWGSAIINGQHHARHLDRSHASASELQMAGINTIASSFSYTKALKVNGLNSAQFSKTFKSTFVPRLKPSTRGSLNKAYNRLLHKDQRKTMITIVKSLDSDNN